MLLYQRQPPQRNCQIVNIPLKYYYSVYLLSQTILEGFHLIKKKKEK